VNKFTSTIWDTLDLPHLQIRSAWEPTQITCVVANTKSNTLTLIAMVVTNIALLLIMLVGLLHLRRHRSGAFGVTHLLWKQVWWRLSLTQVVQHTDMYTQGSLLALACHRCWSPANSKANLFLTGLLFRSSPFNVIDFQYLGLKW